MATRGRPPWFQAVILCALTTAGCIVKVNNPSLETSRSWLDLTTDAQFVDPAGLPATAKVAGIPLTGAASLTGSSLTVGLEGRPAYSVMTSWTARTPGYVSAVRGYGSVRGGTRGSERSDIRGPERTGSRGNERGGTRGPWLDDWTWNSIVFQPTRIEVHNISTSANPAAPAIQEDTGVAQQDADRNDRSDRDGTWIQLPAARAQGFGITDLLELAAGSPDFAFGTAQLPEGHYNQIRFWGADARSGRENPNNTFQAVDASGIVRSGVYKLPGQVLVINVSFDIRRDQTTELFCSFDPVEALKIAGRRVMLRPSTLRASVSYKSAPPPPNPVAPSSASPSVSPDATVSPDPTASPGPSPLPDPLFTPAPAPSPGPGQSPIPNADPSPPPFPTPVQTPDPTQSPSP